MITNDQELQVTQERIAHFQRWLAELRQTARPEEFEAISSGYRLGKGEKVIPQKLQGGSYSLSLLWTKVLPKSTGNKEVIVDANSGRSRGNDGLSPLFSLCNRLGRFLG